MSTKAEILDGLKTAISSQDEQATISIIIAIAKILLEDVDRITAAAEAIAQNLSVE